MSNIGDAARSLTDHLAGHAGFQGVVTLDDGTPEDHALVVLLRSDDQCEGVPEAWQGYPVCFSLISGIQVVE